jgi:hypothetical protein
LVPLGTLAEEAGASHSNPTDLENQRNWDCASYLIDLVKQHVTALEKISEGGAE